MPRGKIKNGNGKRLATPQSVDQAVKSICDIMRRGNCAGAMQYVPELTWILFLRILDEKELREEQEAKALGVPFRASLDSPFRWRDWGAPPETLPEGQTNKRFELQNAPQNAF
ncbi:MAG TPA: type I restriction-modification system subunit M N-terminal domain-containing protein, partial [Candidatus Aminicenantes bacterium]|nr:type I restriction-modification system subunit M N-terminal domain-containing protein [Candidatus Aminicenantes bacterium]